MQERKSGKRTQKVHRPLDYELADTAAVCATSLKLSSASQHIAEAHDIMGYVQFLSEAKPWWWMEDWILRLMNTEASCHIFDCKYFLGSSFFSKVKFCIDTLQIYQQKKLNKNWPFVIAFIHKVYEHILNENRQNECYIHPSIHPSNTKSLLEKCICVFELLPQNLILS